MKRSAGVLLYRRRRGLEVLVGHPGGPLWKRKDVGAWSIPKGEYDSGEDAQAAALREFEEETGIRLEGELTSLGEVKQAGGKIVSVWALERDCEVSQLRSNAFTMEWPPGSGALQQFPEIDQFAWFSMEEARTKLVTAQADFLDRLQDYAGD